MKRYLVELEDAKTFARNNFPAIILERIDGEWREIVRFDWHCWNEERGEPVIELW